MKAITVCLLLAAGALWAQTLDTGILVFSLFFDR